MPARGSSAKQHQQERAFSLSHTHTRTRPTSHNPRHSMWHANQGEDPTFLHSSVMRPSASTIAASICGRCSTGSSFRSSSQESREPSPRTAAPPAALSACAAGDRGRGVLVAGDARRSRPGRAACARMQRAAVPARLQAHAMQHARGRGERLHARLEPHAPPAPAHAHPRHGVGGRGQEGVVLVEPEGAPQGGQLVLEVGHGLEAGRGEGGAPLGGWPPDWRAAPSAPRAGLPPTARHAEDALRRAGRTQGLAQRGPGSSHAPKGLPPPPPARGTHHVDDAPGHLAVAVLVQPPRPRPEPVVAGHALDGDAVAVDKHLAGAARAAAAGPRRRGGGGFGGELLWR